MNQYPKQHAILSASILVADIASLCLARLVHSYSCNHALHSIEQIVKMSDHTYNFNITMTCGGCSGAVERVLKKLDGISSSCLHHWTVSSLFVIGVKSFDVSLDNQTASVVTEPSLDYTTVLEKIKKTGKKVNSGEADGQAQAV